MQSLFSGASRSRLAGDAAWAWGKEVRADAASSVSSSPAAPIDQGQGPGVLGPPGNVGTSSGGLGLIPSLAEEHIPQGLG